jgi:DNA-binding NarL/FixJ family response regulator
MGTMTGIPLLVVDDHALFADALQARLAQEPDLGPVAVAYGPREAIRQVATARPAVVVLDLVLGDASGLDLVEEVRTVAPETRVVILTGVDSVQDAVTAACRGARAWLPKTVDANHLVRVVRGVSRGEAWFAPDLLGPVLTELTTRSGARPDPLAALTARETQVLQCMVDGLSRPQIATRLRVSENTVRTHTQNLIAKLGVHSSLESVALALRSGLRASER